MTKRKQGKQSSIFDEFAASPLATNSPMSAQEEPFTAEEQLTQAPIFGRPTFDDLASAKQQRKRQQLTICTQCRKIVNYAINGRCEECL